MHEYDLHEVAYMLDGDVVGGQVSFPGPDHSSGDRSARFMLAPERPEGFIVWSLSPRTTWLELKTHVEEVLGTGNTFVAPAPGSVEDDLKKVERALRTWEEGFDPRGTPVEAYLRGRGLTLPENAGEALRWVPYCPFGRRQFVPAMVCLVRHVHDDVPLGIHRTAITHEGKKAFHSIGDRQECRMALGPISGGAIKIGKPTDTLGIGEGLESTLSLRAFIPNLPVWSLVSANGVSGFPVIDEIKTLWVAEDNDKAGRQAVSNLYKRWVTEGRTINPVTPPTEGEDLNDLVMRGGVHE
jgi:hypothetical protein